MPKVKYDSGICGDTIGIRFEDSSTTEVRYGIIMNVINPQFPYLVRCYNQRYSLHKITIVSRIEVISINGFEVE